MSLAIGLLAGGCSPPTERTRTAWAGRPAGTAVIASLSDIEGLNPLITRSSDINREIHFQLFRKLARERDDFQSGPPTFAPDLAESWAFSEDGRELTFRLREGLRWSDGMPLTAEDVRWTWQVQVDPAVAWGYSEKKRAIEEVVAADERTVVFRFRESYPDQLADAVEGFILPRHAWGERSPAEWRDDPSWFTERPVGSGAFVLEAWRPGQEIVLVRNAAFHRPGHPKLERVVFRIVPDKTGQINQLLGGQLDYVQQVPPDQAPRLQRHESLDIDTFWSRQYDYVCWNLGRPPFDEREVRRAMTLAIDRRQIIDTLYRGHANLSVGPILSSAWAFDDRIEPWPFDPKVARLVLAKQGYSDSDGDGWLDRDGERFQFEMVANAGNRILLDIGTMVQEQLRQSGIDARLRSLEFQTYVQRITTHDFDAVLGGWNIDTALDLTYAFHSDSIDNGYNLGNYVNPEVDELIEAANRERDLAERKRLLGRIQQILHDEQPYTFLLEPKKINARHRRVLGSRPTALSSYDNLEEWSVEGGS